MRRRTMRTHPAKLLRCARALSTAAADLHPVDGEDAPSTAAAARVMKDAGGFILRGPQGCGICPAASTATAGLGLLRAEFVRRYDAQQVWVDGVDCCVVPPFQKTRKHDEEAPPPSPKNGGCCRRRDDPKCYCATNSHGAVLLAQRRTI